MPLDRLEAAKRDAEGPPIKAGYGVRPADKSCGLKGSEPNMRLRILLTFDICCVDEQREIAMNLDIGAATDE
jgi:hypothetical protein